MNVKTGDKVIVIAGSNKGKVGTIKKVLRKENRVIVEGVNIVHKHQKSNGNESGGILEVEAPIHVSNVMLESKSKKTVKEASTKNEKTKKKEKVSKKSTKKVD